MAVTADQVIVELEAKVEGYNRKVADAERRFDRAMTGIQGAARRTEAIVSVSMRALAAGIGVMGLASLGRQAVQTALDFKRLEQAMAVATGSTEGAAAEFDFLRGLAERLGLRFLTLAETYTGFAAAARGTNIEGEKTRDVFESITTAIVATGGSAEQAEGALRAVEQMVSKGTVSAEELRGQLGERLPGAFNIAARAMGVTTRELGKMMEKGELVSDDFLPRFADQLRKELPQDVQTADAAFQRFQTALDDISNSTADGFMAELGTATDDLTKTLKDMQASGALEAFGAFLGDIIRLGGQAIQVVAHLIQEMDRLQNSQALRGIEKEQATRQARLGITQDIRQRGNDRLLALSVGTTEDLLRRREPSATPPPASGGGGRVSSGGGSSKDSDKAKREAERAAREAERARIEALRRAYDIASEQRRADADILRANMDLAETADLRAFLQTQILDLERIQERAENELAVKLGERTAAEAEALSLKQEERAKMERTAILEEERLRKAGAASDLEDDRLKLGMELLGYEADGARTAGERRAIELKILEMAFERERIELERLKRETKDADEKARLQAQIDALPARQAGAEAGVRDRTRGPLEAYLNSIPQGAAEMNEALEAVAAGGLQSVEDGLVDLITGAKSLGDVFKAVAKQIIADLVRIAIQQAIVMAMGGAPGGGGGGGVLTSLFGGGGGSVPGAANGGSFLIGGRGGRDQNMLSINGSPALRVGRGEQLHIVPQGKALRGAAGALPGMRPQIHAIAPVSFDLRGAVMTKDLVREMQRVSDESARGAAAAMGKAVMQAVPGRMGQFSTDGT